MGALLGSKGMIILGLVAVGLVSLAVCCRNSPWARHRTPRPPRLRTIEAGVESVENGATLRVNLRRRRSAILLLDGIAAPPAGDALAELSKGNLVRLAGQRVKIEMQGGRLFGAEEGTQRGSEAQRHGGTEEEDDYEARASLSGVAYGESGVCLNSQQVADGMARCQADAPKQWRELEAGARKSKLGMWAVSSH